MRWCGVDLTLSGGYVRLSGKKIVRFLVKSGNFTMLSSESYGWNALCVTEPECVTIASTSSAFILSQRGRCLYLTLWLWWVWSFSRERRKLIRRLQGNCHQNHATRPRGASSLWSQPENPLSVNLRSKAATCDTQSGARSCKSASFCSPWYSDYMCALDLYQ